MDTLCILRKDCFESSVIEGSRPESKKRWVCIHTAPSEVGHMISAVALSGSPGEQESTSHDRMSTTAQVSR
jgi:hypothetical protein